MDASQSIKKLRTQPVPELISRLKHQLIYALQQFPQRERFQPDIARSLV